MSFSKQKQSLRISAQCRSSMQFPQTLHGAATIQSIIFVLLVLFCFIVKDSVLAVKWFYAIIFLCFCCFCLVMNGAARGNKGEDYGYGRNDCH